MELLEKRWGIFNPKRMDTLKVDCHPFIGKRMQFEALWLMDKGDPYPGQWAVMPICDDGEWWHLGWVPSEDIDFE